MGSGPVERRHPEQNESSFLTVDYDGDWVRDFVPESQVLVIRAEDALIVLLGCGHSVWVMCWIIFKTLFKTSR